jgi:hypothetical protein
MFSFKFFIFWGGDQDDLRIKLLYLAHFSTDCFETWYIELYILYLDAAQVWGLDV